LNFPVSSSAKADDPVTTEIRCGTIWPLRIFGVYWMPACAGMTMGMGAAVEPRKRTKQLAPSVLARARAEERAGWPALHRRGGARPVALAQLSHWHRLAHGHRLRAAAVVLAAARPRRHRSRARAARSPECAAVVVRRCLGIATSRLRHRK